MSSPLTAPNKRRFIIKGGYPCNNACLFCHASDQPSTLELQTDDVIARIGEAKAMGATGVLLSGGEPTIRKDLPQLAEECLRNGLEFGLITNGRMLSYRPLLKRLLRRGLRYVYMSLHGPSHIHDAITKAPGSFDQSWQAVRLLAGIEGLELTVNTVMVQQNLDHLHEISRLLLPLPSVNIKYTYVEPKGSALTDPKVVPSPTAARHALAAILDAAEAAGVPLSRFGVDGLPHCLDSRFGDLQDDMFSHDICALREVDEEHFFPIDYANMHKPAKCRGCLIGDSCRGSWSRTFELFGDDFLQPIHGGVANSYNYFPAPAPGSPDRTIWTGWQGREESYVTDTADYSSSRLQHIRDELGQVYLQLDDQPMINDFPGQLRKLVPIRAKPGHFAVSDQDFFGPAEKKVRRILAGLQGRVLDVGCGQSQYGDLLNQKLERGEIDYVGIDPAPGKNVRDLAKAGLIDLREQGLEDGRFGRGEFDWVLVLRSHNHLADLWSAYVKVLSALRWGGRLLVVDNISFGLVRPMVTEAAIKALPPGEGIEHLRDHDHDGAASFLRRFPLVEVERQAVGPTTANQWLLLYQKLWPGGQLGQDTYGSDEGGG